MRRIVTAVAAIALMSGAAHAQGQGQGKDNDRGGGKPAAAGQQGGGGGERSQGNGKADRGNGNSQAANGPSMAQAARAPDRAPESRGQGNAKRDERGGGNNGNADRGNSRAAERAVERASNDNRGQGNDNRAVAVDRQGGDRRNNDRRFETGRGGDFARLAPRGLIDGCPPGLAKKNPPCVPPGQVRGNDRDLFRWDRPDFWGLRGLSDGRYFYDDGYLVRYAPSGGILGYVPLLGGALAVGNAWPDYYEPFAMPSYYERYYGLGQYDSYRYADDVIYRVDPQTDAITSIAALLTGDQFAIGQPMPLGYDVYNVPWDYRDRYRDGPDSHYRYADGYVYQVDPKTQLIAAAIELLAS
jgi:hypothetical protein